MIPVRDDSLVPREPSSGEYNAPVIARNEWLEAHPGGKISYPWPGEPGMRAEVDDVVVGMTVRDDLGELMVRVSEAEAEGRCPRHPAGAS